MLLKYGIYHRIVTKLRFYSDIRLQFALKYIKIV